MTASDSTGEFDRLNKDQLLTLIADALRSAIVHYGLWWQEAQHQAGLDETLRLESEVWHKSLGIQMARLGKVLGFEVEDGIPTVLKNKSRDELLALLDALATNWLVTDGIWFQAVENRCGMDCAKRCNDTAWGRFSPFEAMRVKKLLNLPDNGGLEALERALNCRLYARINKQSIERVDEQTLIFRMNQCRVQAARERKGLDPYPCKTGGTIEYTSFARTIDPRIKTECIGCPPDPVPNEWHCAWKFTLQNEN